MYSTRVETAAWGHEIHSIPRISNQGILWTSYPQLALPPARYRCGLHLVAIAAATILVPCHAVKSLQYIWRLGTRRLIYRCPIFKCVAATWLKERTPGTWFNIKMPSYQYRNSHCGDKTVVRSSYLHNGITYTGKMTFLYWTNEDTGLSTH